MNTSILLEALQYLVAFVFFFILIWMVVSMGERR